MKTITPLLLSAALLAPAHLAEARTLQLSFSDAENSETFHQAGNLVMRYDNVDFGVNATITAHDAFESNRPDRSGQNRGDLQINMKAGEEQTFTLTLWDAQQGDGYSQVYTPGHGYSYTLGFYDIDASRNAPLGTYDALSFDADVRYEVSDTTNLSPRTADGLAHFDGIGTGGLVRNDMTKGISQSQFDAMVLVHLRNENSFTFTYGAGLMPGSRGNAGRNLVIDGDELRYAMTEKVYPNPLPAGGLLLLGGLGGLAVAGQKRQSRRG